MLEKQDAPEDEEGENASDGLKWGRRFYGDCEEDDEDTQPTAPSPDILTTFLPGVFGTIYK
jgi:hypothetical protein